MSALLHKLRWQCAEKFVRDARTLLSPAHVVLRALRDENAVLKTYTNPDDLEVFRLLGQADLALGELAETLTFRRMAADAKFDDEQRGR